VINKKIPSGRKQYKLKKISSLFFMVVADSNSAVVTSNRIFVKDKFEKRGRRRSNLDCGAN
jgi:hypothetical protein